MATSKPVKKVPSIAQTKKMISAMNKLLSDHNLGDFKIFEIQLQPKSLNALTSCESLVCNPLTERKIEIHRPDGSIVCECRPKKV